MKTSLYARVSTARQEQEETIDSQVAALQALAQSQGNEVPEGWVFRDEGYSGSTLDRPALDALRDLLSSGCCRKVVIHSPDRLARSFVHQALLLEEWQRLGVEVVFLNRPVAAESPEERMLLQMQGIFAEFERAKILERLRRGRLHKARQGLWVPSEAPYGYRRLAAQGTSPARLEVYEPEAAIVRQMYRRVLDGASIRSLIRWLNEAETPTARGKGKWSAGSIGRMLTNSTYRGVAYANRCQCVEPAHPRNPYRRRQKSVERQRPQEEWIAVSVPAIIAAEEFDDTQVQLQRNRERSPRRNNRYQYLLRGLVRCGHCGLAMTGRRGVYRCKGTDPLCVSRQTPCSAKEMLASRIDEAVWAATAALLQDPAALQAAYQRQQELVAPLEVPWAREVDRLARALRQLEQEQERLVDIYQVGYLSLEALKARLVLLQQRRTELEKARQTWQQKGEADLSAREVWSSLERFSARVKESLTETTFTDRRYIIELVVERVVVTDEVVKVQHIIPLPNSGECTLCPPHRERGGG